MARARANVIVALDQYASKHPNTNLDDIMDSDMVVDIGCTQQFLTYRAGLFPTITAKRAASCDFWLVSQARRVTLDDLCLLQGFEKGAFDIAGARVSEQRFGHMLGNAMCLTIVEEVARSLLNYIGIHPSNKPH